MKKLCVTLMIFSVFISCNKKIEPKPSSPINLSHALNLVDSVEVDGTQLYFIHIYADAPDYKPVEAAGEGVSCVDDVGRFMEVLETEILKYKRTDLLPIARGMTRFLLYMCRDDGLWHNFIDADGKINREYRTSIADFEWWAARGIRGLAAAYNIFKESENDCELLSRLKAKIETTIPQLEEVLKSYPQTHATELGERPSWLIHHAPDMSSEFLLALTKLHSTVEFDYLDAIEKLAEGLIVCQFQQEDHRLNGMYFCWNNIWHGWGNNQAYALLETYKITANPDILKSVQLWADFFIPFLIDNNFPHRIELSSDGTYQMATYPQIAYGINSLYRGVKTLAEITGKPEYKAYAEQIFAWFTGHNIAGAAMYDAETGRVYDGINDGPKVNLNSGAESTIECLLAIQKRGGF
ncbi:MAG: hypothetical protein L6422_07915 [Candidatus Marinimicrobia bacterium]|nr:hypothetical protein [Candidatus Neomarinimicrobiota bacterium]